MSRIRWISAIVCLGLCCSPVLAQIANQDRGGFADATASRLAARIQGERRAANAPALVNEPAVQAVAQRLADEVAEAGSWSAVDLSADRATVLLKDRRYLHYRLRTTYYVASHDEPEAWVDGWLTRARSTFDAFRDPVLTHIGIGRSEVQGLRFCYLIVATSRVAFYRTETLPLRDLEQVRKQIRLEVNAQRRTLRLPALVSRYELDVAAQRYAEDMFARDFYGHESPEGESVKDRVKKTGYVPRRVAENLAAGHTRVDQVMEGWMTSPTHRANIMHRHLREIGIGLAMGEKDGDFKILWVQVFAGKR